MSWPKVKIGDLVESVTKWNPKVNPSAPSFTYIDLSSIDKERKLIHEVTIVRPSEAPSRARQLVQENDVLVSTVRPNLNGVAMIGPEYDGATASTGYCVLRPILEKIHPSFLFHWVKTPHFISEMTRNSTGANYPAVSDKTVKEHRISLPPIDEQKRIVKILDKADEIKQIVSETEKMREYFVISTFDEMFDNYDSNMNNFERTTLGEIGVTVRYGLSQNPPYKDTGTPIIRATNVFRGKISSENMMFCDPEDVPNSKRIILSKNDIIVVRSGAYTGDVAQVGSNHSGSIAGYDLVITPNEKLTPEFLAHWLLSGFVQETHFGRLKRRAGQPHLNRKQVEETPILLPPINLQRKFSAILQTIGKMPSADYLADIFSLSLSKEMLT